jgi:sugar phosphate isomerase/epimerase
MSGIYVSTGAFESGTLAEMKQACEALGAGLELSSGVRWHPGLEAEINEVAGPAGNVLVHNYFPPPREPFVLNLASVNMETRELSYEHVRRAIDLSARCGAPFYSVHSGFAMDLRPGDLGKPEAQVGMRTVPHAVAYTTFISSVRQLSAYGKARGVRLLIENNVITREQIDLPITEPRKLGRLAALLEQKKADPQDKARLLRMIQQSAREEQVSPEELVTLIHALMEAYAISPEDLTLHSPLLMTEPGEMAKFFRYLDDPNVGLLLDVGHAKVAAGAHGFEPWKFFEELAPWIGAIHLSDNDGLRDNNRPFGADAWFANYYMGNIPVVIEVYKTDGEELARMVDIVKRWVGERPLHPGM